MKVGYTSAGLGQVRSSLSLLILLIYAMSDCVLIDSVCAQLKVILSYQRQ